MTFCLRSVLLALIVAAVVGMTAMATAVEAADIPRVSADYLNRKLGNDGLVVIDSRTGSDWQGSKFKIKGAIRGKPGSEGEWSAGLSKDAEIIIYCA